MWVDPGTFRVGFIISRLRLFLGAECDSVVAMPTDRDAAKENKQGTVEQIPEVDYPPPPHCSRDWRIGSHTDASTTSGCGGWAIFVIGLGVHARVPHVIPDIVSHPVSVGRLG